ncbi:GbsR/MarR family transcriptional regulator [Microlunatus speluncae]|uniref:GbsR/MarR family transcriptional regulator n=1 Tax=Microlunatus speluncae TaxID=2594267 RepID=UPI001376129E|nr:helix-turn-helix domain-containing protein [Microlunatus speluncae]
MATAGDGARNEFIEGLALVLAGSGLQRMAARMLAAVLSSESGSSTVPELTETLQVSPAAISGAGRALIQSGFLIKTRNPGDRLDSYSLGGDHWYEAVISRNPVYERLAAELERGVRAVGPKTAPGRRLAETRDFFAFIAERTPELVREWQQLRDARDGA